MKYDPNKIKVFVDGEEIKIRKREKDMPCVHNRRCRYTSGFYCEDCDTFFPKESPEYRSDELLSSICMVLHNINAALLRAGEKKNLEVEVMYNKIGIGKKHDNYEELIAEAEFIMLKHGKTINSATVTH